MTKIKILIVDDEKKHLDTYMELAKFLECEAIGAQSYDEAMRILIKDGNNIHLLLTDYNFKDDDYRKNGLALCNYAYNNFPHIQKILVTVQPAEFLANEGEIKKIDTLIVKVINLYNELIKSISRVRECIINTMALNQKNYENM